MSVVVPLCRAMNDELMRAVEDLEQVAANLTDVSMRLLSEAISDGSTERPALEKRVSQARRAVEKAIHLLSGLKND